MIQLPLVEHFENNDSEGGVLPPLRITEILMAPGMRSSFELLLPMLGALVKEKRWLAWIDPPAALLHQWQARRDQNAMDEVMILRSKSPADAVQLFEKALAAGTCHSVIAWTDALSSRQKQGLELAAEQGNSFGILLRHP